MNKIHALILRVIIALILITFLLLQVNWHDFHDSIVHAKKVFLLCGGLMFFVGVLVSVLRWQIFLDDVYKSITTMKLYVIYLKANFINNFLPTSIGGDIYKVMSMSDNSEDRMRILGSIILDRGISLFLLYLINIILTFYYFDFIITNKPMLMLQIFVIFGPLFALVLLKFLPKNSLLLNYKLTQIIIAKLSKLFSILKLTNKFSLLKALFISLVFTTLVAFSQYLYFAGYGVDIPFTYVFFVSVLLQLVSIIPISFNSIGVTESLGVYLLFAYGIPLEIALAVLLSARIIGILSSLFGGLLFLRSTSSKT
ncbi:MAG: hypothetical protein RLZZ546_2823 [Bacteroidota bacterium]|jgi:uncharacterized protein (TIRG00374 family)